MQKYRILALVIIASISALVITNACAKKDHWGQELNIDQKWWKKEGHSWDRQNKIFMAIGYSNPDWKTDYDLRRSADLNARAEVASFMQSLTKNYMQEMRGHHYAVAESIVESSADETLLGSVIVARHKDKGKKEYRSLIKMDVNYFFNQIYDDYREAQASLLRQKYRSLSSEELDRKIQESTSAAIADLKKLEDTVVEKTLVENNLQEDVGNE